MFLWNTNLVKMKASKLVFSHSIMVKLQSKDIIKRALLNRIQLQNFSLGSCCFNPINKENTSNVSVTGLEQIATIQRISKKKNKLSKLEDMELMEKLKSGEILHSNERVTERAVNTLKEDVRVRYAKTVNHLTNLKIGDLKPNYFSNETDILIIGGGAVGLSIAYSMRNHFPYGPKVTVVDKDDSYPHLSTNLGQGIVSLQLFNDYEEIEILKYGAEFFSAFTRNTEIREDLKFSLNYDPLGSLVLVDESNAEKVIKNNDRLKEFGVNNKVLNKSALNSMFPWLKVDDILFGSLGMYGEGLIDPWAYIFALRCKCESLGVKFVKAEVIEFGFQNASVRRAVCKLPDGSYNFINSAYCIFAGGLESLNLVNLLNESENLDLELKLPLEERMRYEYCFFNSDGPGLNSPIIFNPDGTYFRREGLTGHYVAGVPLVEWNTDDDDDEENNPYSVFDRVVKPFLIERMPYIERLDLVNGWVDVYEFCISNKVGIAGPHPCTSTVMFALGFSHLGLQYLPALGRALMELIYYGSYQTISFEPFHVENLWKKQHLEADRKRRELLEAQQRVAISE